MIYGFIGAGNMCSAVIKGMPAEEIYVYDICREKCVALGDKVHIAADNAEVIELADILVLGLKPNVLGGFLEKYGEKIQEKKPLLISLAAGKNLSFLKSALDKYLPIVRVMPNINSFVMQSTTGYCCNNEVTLEQKAAVERLFGSIGTVVEIEDESKFPAFSAIAGAAPAFCYMYIDALARAGQKNGLCREQALKAAAETVYGSAKMILESSEHPYALIDKVCSPGGTTIEGISVLQKEGFEAAVTDAVDAVIEKDNKLSK